MARYFSIAIDGVTEQQEMQIAASWTGHAWWHGVAGFWLLRDHLDCMTAESVRDGIGVVIPVARVMVVQIAPITWAGNSMNEANREWLRKYWPPEGG